MPRMPYVQRRQTGYYYRQRVPVALQAKLGKSELVVSLNTLCPKAAAIRGAKLFAEVRQQIEGAITLHKKVSPLVVPTRENEIGHEQAAALAEGWLADALNRDFDRRLTGLQPNVIMETPLVGVGSLTRDLQQIAFEKHQRWIDRVLAEMGIRVSADSASWKRVAYHLLQVRISYEQELDRRNDPAASQPMAFRPVLPPSDAVTLTGTQPDRALTISQALEGWIGERERPRNTVLEWKTHIRRFVELRGNLRVTNITADDIRAFREASRQIPRRKTRLDRTLALPELMSRYEGQSIQRVSAATVRKAVGAVGSVLAWCVDQGRVETNVAEKVRVIAPESLDHDVYRFQVMT